MGVEGTNAAVLKALAILDYLSVNVDGQRLKDLAGALKLPESTTHRLLNSLASSGYVQQNPRDQTYRIGWKAVTLARAVDREVHLVESIHPFLERLAERTGYTANVAVLQQAAVMYLDCVVPPRSIIALYMTPGSLAPAHATSLGKVLLAGLPGGQLDEILAQLEFDAYTPTTVQNADDLRRALEEIRSRGYAVDRGEYVPDVNCAAAPISHTEGVTIAAISVTARAVEFPREMEREVTALLVETAAEASRGH